jgi:nicotinate-nucleotide adenylyltransferase
MDIALYGGSFDPPHLGHIAVVNEALKTLDIDKVIVVPAFVNPFKTGTHAPAELRLAWLKAIFKANSRVEVSDFEIRQNRAVRSIETVKHFGALYAKIYFIIGADNLATLKKWHRYEELNSLVTWVVATRDDIEIEPGFIRLNVEQKISSSALRETILEQKLPTSVAMSIKDYYKSTSQDPK